MYECWLMRSRDGEREGQKPYIRRLFSARLCLRPDMVLAIVIVNCVCLVCGV